MAEIQCSLHVVQEGPLWRVESAPTTTGTILENVPPYFTEAKAMLEQMGFRQVDVREGVEGPQVHKTVVFSRED